MLSSVNRLPRAERFSLENMNVGVLHPQINGVVHTCVLTDTRAGDAQAVGAETCDGNFVNLQHFRSVKCSSKYVFE